MLIAYTHRLRLLRVLLGLERCMAGSLRLQVGLAGLDELLDGVRDAEVVFAGFLSRPIFETPI